MALISGIVTVLSALVFYKYIGFAVRNLAPLLTAGHRPVQRPRPRPAAGHFIHRVPRHLADDRRLAKKVGGSPQPARRAALRFVLPATRRRPHLRANQFVPQLAASPDPQRIALSEGVLLILLGLLKKVVLADYLAGALVDLFYADPQGFGTVDAWLAFYGYAVQIYCDFSISSLACSRTTACSMA